MNESRADQQRAALETWAKWWDGPGRLHYAGSILPPIKATRDALGCTLCAGESLEGEYCRACGRKDA